MPRTIDRPTVPVGLTLPSQDEAGAGVPPLARLPYFPWLMAALLGSWATVLLGWAAVGAVVAAGWMTMPSLSPALVLDTIAQVWLGAHGVPFQVAGLSIGLTPLGLSALIGVALAAVARYATQQREEGGPAPVRFAALVAGSCTAAYSLLALLLATLVGDPRQAASAFVGALVVSASGSLVGALRACGVRVLGAGWVRGVCRGAMWGIVVLAAESGVALAVSIVAHRGQIQALQSALAPDAVGAVLLVLAYVAYAPTLLLWAGSYVLGAGFGVGSGTLFSPLSAAAGIVPGIPVAGALPVVPPSQGWLLLASGPAAGALAGLVASRRRADAVAPGALRSTLAGGAAALAAGLVWTAASWLSCGDLGSGRLVGLGPRFPQLLLLGTLPLAAAGLAAGAAQAWRARAVARRAARAAVGDARPERPWWAFLGIARAAPDAGDEPTRSVRGVRKPDPGHRPFGL